MYDYIIVGAGSSGCVLAARLTEDPNVKVLLVEAGKRDRHPYLHMPAGFAKLTGTMATWGWSTVPQRHVNNQPYWYPQGRVVGGGSSINAMVYMRGNAWDYDNWANEHGCDGWSYRDVLPYFKRSEDNEMLVDEYHSAGGPLGVSEAVGPLPISRTFIRAGQQAGIPYNRDFNGHHQHGVGFYQTTTRNARRSSAAVAYLRPALSRPNLTVWTETMTHRLLVSGNRVDGIEVVRKGEKHPTAVRCEGEVILTSGAIGSPRTLMLSGIGDADELRKLGITPTHNLPGVGKNFHDHFDLYIVSELTGDFSYDKHNKWHKSLAAGLQYLLFRNGPVASNLCEAGGFWFTDPTSIAPDIQFHFMLGAGVNDGVTKLENCGVTLNTAHMRPRSRGTVSLASADPAAAPLIDPNFWADPYDREMSIAGFRLGREIMRQDAFKGLVKTESLPGANLQTDDEIVEHCVRYSKTDYHPVGSCRMGRDRMAVVDPDTLKLHGLEGLRVCDSSIMPQVVSSNTNAPTIMIAERASDIIRGLPRYEHPPVANASAKWAGSRASA